MIRIGFLLTVSLLFVGCSVSFPVNVNFKAGQTWDMQAANGDITHFELLPLHNVGCQSGELLDMHTTKTQARAYWQAGLPGAEIHWILHRDKDGNWHSVSSLINWDPSVNPGLPHTINYIPSNSSAYLIVPGQYSGPVRRTGYANWWSNFQQQTNTCLQDIGEGPTQVRWTARFTMRKVNTPVYQGVALAAEQFEGCPPDWETFYQTQCAHEIWYFAQGIGLVEINAVWEHTDIKRIN